MFEIAIMTRVILRLLSLRTRTIAFYTLTNIFLNFLKFKFLNRNILNKKVNGDFFVNKTLTRNCHIYIILCTVVQCTCIHVLGLVYSIGKYTE